jgi:Rrf2 family protein
MAHFGNSTEYGLHCLLWLVEPHEHPPSSRDLAELQGVSPSFVAKIFPRLEKAGLVTASEGIRGGYRLARAPDRISVLDVVDAIEGKKPLFDCQDVRRRCALYDGSPPSWSGRGMCGIHAVMVRAEQRMREELARTTLADLARGAVGKAPADFGRKLHGWMAQRINVRTEGRAPRKQPPRKRGKRKES